MRAEWLREGSWDRRRQKREGKDAEKNEGKSVEKNVEKSEEKNEGKGFSNAQDVVFVDTGLILKAMAGMQKSQEEFQSLREQAELGDTAVYYDLAARYSAGDGVDADPEKAAHWLAMAADLIVRGILCTLRLMSGKWKTAALSSH